MAVAVRLVGAFHVQVDAAATAPVIGSAKERRLLALLAARRGQVVPPDRLAEALWDGRMPERPARNLATWVSRLRALLGADVIAGRPPRLPAGRGVGGRCGGRPSGRGGRAAARRRHADPGRRRDGTRAGTARYRSTTHWPPRSATSSASSRRPRPARLIWPSSANSGPRPNAVVPAATRPRRSSDANRSWPD